jgi:hypothetical protein
MPRLPKLRRNERLLVVAIGWAAAEALPAYISDVDALVQKSELPQCRVVVSLDAADQPDLLHSAL